MKKHFIYIPLALIGLVVPFSLVAINQDIVQKSIINPGSDNQDEEKAFKVPDYFYSKTNLEKKQIEIENRINKIVQDYDLKKWVEFYSNDFYTKKWTKIWELNWDDYKIKINILKSIPNSFNNSKYKNFDEQQKHFEDFVFTINPIINKDKLSEDDSFLFRRYQLLSIQRAKKFKASPFSKYTFSETKTIIGEAATTGDFTKVSELIATCVKWILKNYFKPYLAAVDLYMRIRNKKNIYQENYSHLLNKAKAIYDYENNKFSSLINDAFTRSVPSTKPPSLIEPTPDAKTLIGIIKQVIKSGLEIPNIHINESDFYTKKEKNE